MTYKRRGKHLNLRVIKRFKRRRIRRPMLLRVYDPQEDNEDAHRLEDAVDVEEVVVTTGEVTDKVVEEDPGTVEDRQHIKDIAVIIITNYLNIIIVASQVISQKDMLKDDVKVVHKISHRIIQTKNDSKIHK